MAPWGAAGAGDAQQTETRSSDASCHEGRPVQSKGCFEPAPSAADSAGAWCTAPRSATLWGTWGTVTQPARAPQPEGPGCPLQVELEPSAESRGSLSEGIRGLYQRCLLYDLTVLAAGKRFPAHQVALAATSPSLRDHVVEAVRLAAAPPAEEPAGSGTDAPVHAGQASGQLEDQAPSGSAAPPGSAAPREGPPGQPELHLDQIGEEEAARAFLDFVYNMSSTYNISSDEANADVLRLAQQFGLAPLQERAAQWLLEAVTTDNVVSRLVALQEFGLATEYELVSHELITNPLALEQVARKAQLMDHPKLLQGLLVQAAQLYRGGSSVSSRSRSRSPRRSSSWSDRRAKASRKLAHVGA